MLKSRVVWVHPDQVLDPGRAAIASNHGTLARASALSRDHPSHPGSLSGPRGSPNIGRQPVDENLSVRLPGGPDAAARARRELSRLQADLDAPLAETLRLLVTELVSNAVRHAAADTVSLRVLVGRAAVFTEVKDAGPGFDPASTGVPRSNHTGWGLFLVQRLADRWGAAHEPAATRVWFELRRA
jgi:anti-sigma regulatory factor (Ser/Thr protein kinase)